MPSFMDFLLPQNTGLNPEQLNYADRMGLLNAASTLADMSAPKYNAPRATPMQLIASGLGAYATGGAGGVNQFYNTAEQRAKAAQSAYQEAMEKDNLAWFNNQNSAPPDLNSFYQGQKSSSSSAPLGVKNNNLGNIRDNPANKWKGQIGQEGGFAKFDSPASGNRAQAMILNSYAKRGVNTIRDIVSTYAPASDGNNPDAYAAQVSKILNIDPDNSLNMNDPALVEKLVSAMQQVEVGPKNATPYPTPSADPRVPPGYAMDPKLYPSREAAENAPVPGMPPVPAVEAITPQARADHFYKLAEMQMRGGRPGSESALRLASLLDPNMSKNNSQGFPAVIQVADELAKARAAGDTQRVQDLVALSKTMDKGIMMGDKGVAVPIQGYGDAKKLLSYKDTAGSEEAKADVARMQKQSDVVAKLPLLENDLNTFKQKLDTIDPALMGPIRGTVSYYTSPDIQALTSNARSIALQLKDIYNLGSGQGFTDADRNYIDSIVGGAKVDPVAAVTVLNDIYQRISVQKDLYKQTSDAYQKGQGLTGFMPIAREWETTPSGVKYKVMK